MGPKSSPRRDMTISELQSLTIELAELQKNLKLETQFQRRRELLERAWILMALIHNSERKAS